MLVNLKALEKKFNALLVRERLLIVFSTFAAIYMIFELAILGPSQRKYVQLQVDVETQKKQYETLKAEEVILTKVLTTDPSLLLKKELDSLSVQLSALDGEVIDLSAGLVSANQLAAMLQEILLLSVGLQLEGLSTDIPQLLPLPGDELTAASKTNMKDTKPAAQMHIYKQYVSLKLKGEYFAILNYLKRLEATHWRFYWEALHYQVNQYPDAEVEIRVYSLSIERI